MDSNGEPFDGLNHYVNYLERGEIQRITFEGKKLSDNGTFRVWLRK